MDHHLKTASKRPNSSLASPMNEGYPPQTPHSAPPAANQRQKSLEYMDQGMYLFIKEWIDFGFCRKPNISVKLDNF